MNQTIPICKFCRHKLSDNFIKADGNIYCNPNCLIRHMELRKNVDLWLSTKVHYEPVELDIIINPDWRD